MKYCIIICTLFIYINISGQDSIRILNKPIKTAKTIKPSNVLLNYNYLYLFKGDKPKLIARVIPGEAFNKKVIWETSNPNVATIDNEGNVNIAGEGITVITVITEEGRHKAECKIEVDKKNEYGNTSGNISAGGELAVQGAWIYFANPSDRMKLYKMRMDGSEKTKLCDDKISYINVTGHLMLYRNDSDNGKIYAININGDKRICINDLDHNITNLFLFGTWLYYINTQDGSRIYSISIGGDHRHIVYENRGIRKFTLVEDYIYIGSEQTRIYKAKRNVGSELALLNYYGGDPIWDLNTIYFRYGDGRLAKRVNNDNHTYQITVNTYNAANNWVYYSTDDEKMYLKKVHSSGNMDQVLASTENINAIYIADSWIYFYRVVNNSRELYKVRNDGLHLSRVE